jgi:hypothetical protein
LLQTSKQQLRKNINNKKQLLLNHKLIRQRDFEALQRQRSSQGQTKEAEIIGKIATKEMRKADRQKLRNIFNPRHTSGICNIEIPDDDAHGNPTSDPDKALTWKRIYDPKQVEEKILEHNIKHFGQAEGTLFTRREVTDIFDYEGASTNASELLLGNFDVHSIPTATVSARTLLHILSNENKLQTIADHISLQEFIKAFKTWKESTSTSPSGRHLGH